MSHLGRNQKIAIAVGGVLIAYLIYRWYENNAGASSTSTGTADTTGSGTDEAATDYAAESGQEQSDVASLQSQIAAEQGQEQSDVGSLGSSITALSGQVAALPTSVSVPASLTNSIKALTKKISSQQKELNEQAAGLKKLDRKKEKAKAKAKPKPKPKAHTASVFTSPNRFVAPVSHAPKAVHPAARPSSSAASAKPAAHPAAAVAHPSAKPTTKATPTEKRAAAAPKKPAPKVAVKRK